MYMVLFMCKLVSCSYVDLWSLFLMMSPPPNMSPPPSGGAVTADTNCCANCVETSRPQECGPIYRVLGKPAMRTRWMAGAAPHKSG